MSNNINMISDDFSDGDDDAPPSPPKVPDGARKLPKGPQPGLYAPTSDVKPIANPDPLQRREVPPTPPQLQGTNEREPLFCPQASKLLH